MTSEASEIFNTVARQDYLQFRDNHGIDYRKIATTAELSKPDLSNMTDVKVQRVRFDRQIPKAIKKRLEEIGNILNLVAEFFEGDGQKTVLWFLTKNPGLGNISPRDMIRMNRHDNLLNFILAARQEHGWGE